MFDPGIAEMVELVCPELEAVGILYAITGSVASAVHGEPFNSVDVDIAVRMSERQATELAARLSPRLYREVSAMIQAVRDHSSVNLIDNLSRFKIDLSVLAPEPFYNSVLARRQLFQRPGKSPVWMVTPEDIILMKLQWRKETRSEKQWENALSVVRTNGARLNWDYLHDWAQDIGVKSDLRRLKEEAGL